MFPCSHENISFLQNGKKGKGIKKRVVFLRGVMEQLSLYFYVYFEESPPAEEPYDIMLRELPQFYMFPSSHGNISF
jgi:hypothetical protein